jgi:hypothetical protein
VGQGRPEEESVNVVALVLAAATLWLGQAVGVARLMSRVGFHPLPWFAVAALLGPAMWPLAVVDLVSGLPRPVSLRRGGRGPGALDVFVAVTDEFPEQIAMQLRRLLPYSRRVVIARVIKAGGPAYVTADAESFLTEAASRLAFRDAGLQIHYGDLDRVVAGIQQHGNFSLVMRGDRPSELFDGDGSRQEMRCLRDVKAA